MQLKKSHRNPTGEFAVVCRAGSIDKHLKSDQKQPKNREWMKHVKETAVETASHNSTSSDDEFFSQAVKHLKQVRKIKSGDHYRQNLLPYIIIIIIIIIFISLFFTANFTGYSRLLGEETSRNHQAYKDITTV